MIVRVFKTNQIYIFFFIPILLLGLRWPTLFGQAPFTSSGQLPFLFDFFTWMNLHPIFSLTCSIAAITFQGYWLSETVNEHRLFPYISNLPAFVLAVFYSVLSPQTWFSPVICANVLIILSFRKILDTYQQGEIKADLFRAGVYMALASMFYLPALYLLLVLIYALAITRKLNWREYVIPIVGMTTVYFYLFSLYFLKDETEIFFNYFIEPKTYLMVLNWNFITWLPGVIVLTLTVISLSYMMITNQRRTVRENNMYKIIAVAFVLTALFSLIYIRDLYSVTALICPALTIIVTYFFLSLERKWLQEGIAYCLLLAIVVREILVFLE